MKYYVITIMNNENSISSAKRTIHSAQQYGIGSIEHWKATTPADDPEKIILKSKRVETTV